MLYLSHLTASVLALTGTVSGLTYTNVSEVPYYGLSPPVYPSRTSGLFFRTSSILTSTQPKVTVGTMRPGRQRMRLHDLW